MQARWEQSSQASRHEGLPSLVACHCARLVHPVTLLLQFCPISEADYPPEREF
jgi:hypothetical protein